MIEDEDDNIPVEDSFVAHPKHPSPGHFRGRPRTINIQWAFYYQPTDVIVIVKAASLEAALPKALNRLKEVHVRSIKSSRPPGLSSLILVKTNSPHYKDEFNGLLYSGPIPLKYSSAKKSAELILGLRDDAPPAVRNAVIAGIADYREHLIATTDEIVFYDDTYDKHIVD